MGVCSQKEKESTLTAFVPCHGGRNGMGSKSKRLLLPSSSSRRRCLGLGRKRRTFGCNTSLKDQVENKEEELDDAGSINGPEEEATVGDAPYLEQDAVFAEQSPPAVATREFGSDDISIVEEVSFQSYNDAYDDEMYGDDVGWDQGRWVRMEEDDEEYYLDDADDQSFQNEYGYDDDYEYEGDDYDNDEYYSQRPSSGNFWNNPVGSIDRQPQSPRRRSSFSGEPKRRRRRSESSKSPKRRKRSSTQFQTLSLSSYAPSWLRELGYRIFFHGLPELEPDPSFRRGRFSQDILHEIDELDIRKRRQRQQRLPEEDGDYEVYMEEDDYYYDEADSKRQRTPLAPLPQSVDVDIAVEDDNDDVVSPRSRPSKQGQVRKPGRRPSERTRRRSYEVNDDYYYYEERKPLRRKGSLNRRSPSSEERIPSLTDALDSFFGVDKNKVQAKAARYDQTVLGGQASDSSRRRSRRSSPVEEPPRKRKGYAYRYVDDDDQEPVADYYYDEEEEIVEDDVQDTVRSYDNGEEEEEEKEDDDETAPEGISTTKGDPVTWEDDTSGWIPPPAEVGAWGPNGPIEGENARTLAARRAKEEIQDARLWLERQDEIVTRAEQKLQECKGLYRQGQEGSYKMPPRERSKRVAAIQVWSERVRRAQAEQTAADRDLKMLLSKYSVLLMEFDESSGNNEPPFVEEKDED